MTTRNRDSTPPDLDEEALKELQEWFREEHRRIQQRIQPELDAMAKARARAYASAQNYVLH